MDDELAEGPETITVHGTASGLSVDDATLTLNDDDTASTSVSLSLDTASVSEDDTAQQIEVTAELNQQAGTEPTAVNVTVGRAGDTAASGTDYTPVAGFAVTIAAGQTTGTASFTLRPTDDQVAEGPEEITVQGTASGLTVDDATLTLNDDDAASTSVSLSLDPGSVSEDAGSVSVEVTAELNGAAGTEPTAVNVTVGRTGDSAIAGTDYTPVAGFAVTIAAGQTTGTASFTLRPTDDQVAEGPEEITVQGTASGLSVDDATLTLNDDDAASTSVSLSLDTASVSEDDTAQQIEVTAELNQQAGTEPTAVNVTVGRAGDTAASGTDYTPVAGFAVTIAAGQTTGTASFTLRPTDDQVAEGPEEITVHGTASGFTVDDATLTLNDDDAASTSVSLSVDPGSVSEDAGSVSVEVTAELNGAAGTEPTAVNVTVGRTGDSAIAGTDYPPVAGFAVTIAAGQTTGTATFSLAPDDDEVAEGPEEITVRGTASGFTVADTTLTLNDDDQASNSVSLSLNPASVSERDGTVTVEVTAELNAGARPDATAVQVSVGVPGDSATSGTDYDDVSSFILQIPPRTRRASETFTLRLTDDAVVEASETITVAGTAAGLQVEPAALALQDNDSASASLTSVSLTSVSLSLDPGSVSEDAGSVSVEVTAELNGAADEQPIAVNVTVGRAGDSAASGTDYPPVAGFAVTIPGGQTTGTATFTLTPEDDEIAESPETITVHGTAVGRTVESATLILQDGGGRTAPLPTLRVSLHPVAVAEGDGPTELTATVEAVTGPSPREIPFMVRVGAPGDSATAGTDYERVPDFQLRIAAGSRRGEARFLLRPVDDNGGEGDEAITLVAVPEQPEVGRLRTELRLLDNDSAASNPTTPTKAGIRIDDATAPEGAGQMHFRVTLDQAAPVPVSLDWSTQTSGLGSDLAEAGADYVDASGTLVIPAGQVEGTISVVLRNDRVDELDERFEVVLWNTSAGVMADDRAVGTIRDDDGPSLTIRDANRAESQGWLEFEVSLSAPSSQPVKGRIVTADRTAKAGLDYDLTNSSFEIAPGGRYYTVRILITDDALHERRETFLVAVRDVQNATITAGEAVGTIEDDDPAPRLIAAPASAKEDDGELIFDVRLTSPSGLESSVIYATADRTATESADYQGVSGMLVFAPGETFTRVRVRVIADVLDEADETFTLEFSEPTHARIGTFAVTATIEDDDAPPRLSAASASAREDDGEMTFDVRLSGASGRKVSTRYATFDRTAHDGADYEGVSRMLTFAPGETLKKVTVEVIPDVLDEDDETFTLEFSEPTNAILETPAVVGTIRDDEAPPKLTAAPASAREDDGEMTFDVRLSGASGREVSTRYATFDRTAHDGADYEGVSRMLTFAPGETLKKVVVEVIPDVIDEDDETFTLEFSEPTHARIGTFAVTATIEDDDAPPRLSAASASAREDDGEMTFDVRLSSASGLESSVIYATADGTATESADYQGVSGMLIFAPGETFTRVRVRVIADVLDEADETFTLEFSEPTHARIGTFAVTATIEDDDAPPRLSAASASAREDDGEMTFDVRLSGASGRKVSVKYATADGTAHEEADYEGVSETLTFAPGETLKKVAVEVIPDVLDEDDETFTLEFSEPTNAILETPAVVGTIRDDEAPPKLTAAPASAREDDGEMTFDVRLSGASGREVSTRYATFDRTAHDGADYEGVSRMLIFAPGETSKQVSVTVIPDVLHEADETFTLEFREPTHTDIETTAVVGTIRDDDAVPALRIHDARASEQAGVIAFRATLEAVAGRDLHYSVWTTDGEAVAGEDYDGMRSQLLIPAGEAAALVQVSVLDDNVDETEETFRLTVDGGRVTGTEGRSAIGTIEDDDDNEPVARMLITRFGRAAATHLVEAVDQRMGSDSLGTRFSLGLDPTQTVLQTAHRNAFGDGWQAMRERTGAAGLDPQHLLGRSSFLVQPGTSGAATDEVWTLWGRGATQRFAGEADGISVEGSVLTSTIGFDYRRGGLLAGLALSNSLGTGEFSVVGSETNGSTRAGAARSRLSTLSPYVSVPLGGRIAVWGLGGLGLGKFSLGADEESVALEMQLAAIGARGQLWAGSGRRNARLIFKTDMFWVKTSADATAVRLGSTGRASRGRVLLEGSRRLGSLWGGEITPVIEAGVRSDGGDAETGLGLEMGTGIRYEGPSRLHVELNARSLVVHQDVGYREWGIGGTVRLDRGADRRGLSLAIASSQGNALSGVNQMWNSNSPLAQGASFADAGSGRLEAEVGYGLGSFAGGPLVPFAGVAWQEGASRAFRIGSRFQLGSSLHLSLEGSRRDGSQYRPDNAFIIRAHLR